ncbi:helix-turn-helix domain-containing protein [Streptomyces viridodiastaticus]|uniref:helix-turn-helix domain-containing protein n=1 Tax=Streptomyces albogriseolus TaxID=1887 RepID=UPI002255408B|nr:helix-turn-helix transcriptional regulator [Streptomyces viridodiastaticus]MCX4568404.1 helix-turn-helix domain-containing protein [Streptomyces viridodiastaticus]
MPEHTAAADFAALLRELKDRSGLSYGVLAKRLHMSTSTLHRYCNGDAVPADYAPVERLARLCKAHPEELVELHRRWVLADAVRGRKGAAAAETPPEEAGSGTGPGQAASEAAPPAEAASAGAPPAAPADADTGVGTAPARRRTRTAVLAGIAVAAVAAGVAFAVGLPGGGSDGDGDGGRHRPVGAAGVTAEGTAPASSSPPSSAAASPSSPAKDKGPARTPAGSAPAGAPSGEGQKSGVPVTVRAEPYAWESPCSQRYLADKPANEMKPPPLEEGAAAWVAAHGAVSSGQQYLRLTVQGTGPETVVVDGLTVRVAGKRAPLAWNDYAMAYPGVGCGGGVQTRAFAVSLDSARPSLTPEPGNEDFPFKVSESDPEVYYLTASVSAYDVDWYLELKWSSGDRSGTLTVDDEGRPFRTSGNKGRPAYEFPIGGDGWVPEGTTKLE